MEYRVVSVDPTKPYGHQAQELEKMLDDGYDLHGDPFIWQGRLLQTIVKYREESRRLPSGNYPTSPLRGPKDKRG